MQDYQKLYQNGSEPWDYSRRAAEILRHEAIVQALRETGRTFGSGLDIGCSLGQLSSKIKALTPNLYACDVAFEALRSAGRRQANGGILFLAAGLPGLPFKKGQFDLVVLADGVHEFVPESLRDRAMREISSCLVPGGLAVFSDYMRPGNFGPFIDLIGRHFKIQKLIYLNDRLWYQFESWFKALRNLSWVRALLTQV